MIFGNFKTYEVTVTNTGHSELDLSNVVGSEYEIRIQPGADKVRVLFTPASSVTIATVTDFLLDEDTASVFEVGRGLNRISLYNSSGGSVKVSIAVMF